MRDVVRCYQSGDERVRVYAADSRRLDFIESGSIGVIVTSPPYWVRGRGAASANRWARLLAVEFGAEWRRVLRPDGDLWLVIGDRHDGREWIGLDGIVTAWLRQLGWRLQAKGCWAQTGSRERWDNRINYVLRFGREGRIVRPDGTTLAWMLPLPRSHPESAWDATPVPVIRAALAKSRKLGAVLDPFAGAGTTGLVAREYGRRWVGVERDPRMARLAARRLRLRRASAAAGRPPGRRAAPRRAP